MVFRGDGGPRMGGPVPGRQAGDRRVLLHRDRHAGQRQVDQLFLGVDGVGLGQRLTAAQQAEGSHDGTAGGDVGQMVGHDFGRRCVPAAHRASDLLRGRPHPGLCLVQGLEGHRCLRREIPRMTFRPRVDQVV